MTCTEVEIPEQTRCTVHQARVPGRRSRWVTVSRDLTSRHGFHFLVCRDPLSVYFYFFFFFFPWTRWARGFATAPEKRHTRALAFLSLHSVFVFPCQCRLCVPMFSSTELPVSFSSSYHQGYETGPLSSILAHTLRRSPKGIEPTWRRRGDIYAVTVTSGLCKFP